MGHRVGTGMGGLAGQVRRSYVESNGIWCNRLTWQEEFPFTMLNKVVVTPRLDKERDETNRGDDPQSKKWVMVAKRH